MEILLIVVAAIIGMIAFRVAQALFGTSIAIIIVVVALYLTFGGDAHAATEAANTVTSAPVTLQDSLVSIINQVQSGVSAGVSFLQAEIPDVIRQLLVWKAIEASFWAIFEFGLFVLSVVVGYKAIKRLDSGHHLYVAKDVAEEEFNASSYRDEDKEAKRDAYKAARAASEAAIPAQVAHAIVAVILGIIGAIAFCSIWSNVLTALQIWIAPKVWLIEYAASLVK